MGVPALAPAVEFVGEKKRRPLATVLQRGRQMPVDLNSFAGDLFHANWTRLNAWGSITNEHARFVNTSGAARFQSGCRSWTKVQYPSAA